MKLAGVARFDCIGSTQEFACYMAGLASPGDHTCGWTTSTLHSHLAWRYWFRWGCGASSATSVIADLAGGHIPYPRSTGPDHAAMHPLRRDTPDPSQYTRSEGVQCLRIGCTTPHNKHNCGQLRSVTLQACFTKAVQEALHPLRRATPVTSRCTRSEEVYCLRIGCTAAHNKHNRENVSSRKKPRRLPLGNRRGLALTIQLSRSW